MAPTAFDDIALEGQRHFDHSRVGPATAAMHRRVRRRRAARGTVMGGAAVAACGAVAVGAAALQTPTRTASPSGVVDPATIAVAAAGFGSGGNLIGSCEASELFRDRSASEVRKNQFSILTGVVECNPAPVRGTAPISATTSLRTQEFEDNTVTWLRTTITNDSGGTLAFDLASPTLAIAMPEDADWFYETMTAARPLQADERWSEHPDVESWGGSGSPRGGIDLNITPVLEGPPAPGVVWNLVLERPQDEGLLLSTSRGTVTLAPGASFVFESSLNSRWDAQATTMLQHVEAVDAWVYIALQADTAGGSPRTLLVDNDVPLTWED